MRAATGPVLSNAYAMTSQTSALTVIGTPALGDLLVFHFAASYFGSALGSGGVDNTDWGLFVFGGSPLLFGQLPFFASAAQFYYGDGSSSPLLIHNGQVTANGFDLVLPFSFIGNTSTTCSARQHTSMRFPRCLPAPP